MFCSRILSLHIQYRRYPLRYEKSGAKVFGASYDAWDKQTITLNPIGLHHGYTGHEMPDEFDIINMNQRSLSQSGESNGRLYAPVLGRFFSPDNYVQMPDNSQNFNRYSYCLNNLLKYMNPSGNLFGIDDAVIAFTAFSMGSNQYIRNFGYYLLEGLRFRELLKVYRLCLNKKQAD